MAKQTIDFGKVGVKTRGEWSPVVADYEYLDLVSHKGGSYVVKQRVGKVPVGVLPTDKTYYQTSADKGDKPSFTIGLNGHWIVDGEDSGWVASTGTDNMDAVYGIQYNVTHATPILERIGENMFNHITLPVQSKMRRCVVNLDRTVNYWLHKDDSTKKEDGTPANLTGADGQFQVWLPDRYMRFSQGGNMARAETSLYPFVGAKFYPAEFISVGHATVQRSTNKMMSVVNDDPDYAGGGTGVNIYNSVARTNLSRAVGRTYARNLGVGWELQDYTTDLSIYWGYVIEYANFNSQLPFIAERTAEGYKQGGLGNGVTNASSAGWSGFNGSYPFVPIGYTASLGNNTGVKELIIPDFGGSEFITQVPSYRGIENPFGHIFTILDGIQCFFETGQSFNTYVTDDPALFNDTNHNGFRFVGSQPMNASGYITEMHFGEFGDTVTKANVGGSATTYMCDYQYLPTTTNEYKWYAKGGNANNGASAGLGCVSSSSRVSHTRAYYGFRLCAKRKRST